MCNLVSRVLLELVVGMCTKRYADSLKATMGKTNTWAAGVTVPSIDEGLILNAWKWYLDLLETAPGLVMGTYVLMEVMQKVWSPRFWQERYRTYLRRLRTNLLGILAR